MLSKKLSLLLVVVPITLLISCAGYNKVSSRSKNENAKNVIFMIGDGMGLAHIYAAMTVSPDPLNIERTTVTGLQKNYSSDNYITDSGASGTALATGSKTKNSSIGVDASGNRLKSILELAEENGLSTGLISTSALTHATPASFIAHQQNRNSYEQLALDFLKTDVDVLIGGGYNHFARRRDKLNLIDSLRNNGYEIISNIDELKTNSSSKIAAFTAAEHHPYRLKGRGDMLPVATSKAIEVLSRNKKGFFLMVEGSQIDWAAHANAADTLIDEVLDFDQAIGVALDFAEKDGNTLVIVTADHETGGVTITGGNINKRSVKLEFSSTDHTAVMLPVFATGPGSSSFAGIYDNTSFFGKIKSAFGF